MVEVVAYSPAWPKRFEAAQRLLVGALPTALSVEHIGSTSIPGLAAKPAAAADATRRYEAAKRRAAERHPDSRARYARVWRSSAGRHSAET